jgi:hypothetical protein
MTTSGSHGAAATFPSRAGGSGATSERLVTVANLLNHMAIDGNLERHNPPSLRVGQPT